MKPIHCSQCHYDLAGLPGAGNCPECGQRYWVTRGQGIKVTESAELRGSRLVKKIRTILLLVAALVLILIGAILQYGAGKQHAMLTGSGVGLLLLLCAGISYGLERDEK